ncbi:MAG: TlpA family protein disulfide reductase [Acidimicrobiales bacterium]
MTAPEAPLVDIQPANLGAPSAARPGQSPSHRVRWLGLSVGVLAVLLVAALAKAPPAANVEVRSPLLGHPAPPIAGPSVTPYRFTSLVASRGRWVLVNFFATWCVACRQEQPQLARFAAEHRGADVQLVMVVYNDTAPNVRAFLAAQGGKWPAVLDPGGQVALSYGVGQIPDTYLIDPHGIVVAKLAGASTAAGLDRLLALAKARHL